MFGDINLKVGTATIGAYFFTAALMIAMTVI